MHGILFEGLDPQRARGGLFGKGTYFAANAAKIDHYSTEDTRWHEEGQPLHELHKKLFWGCLHPKRVRYALVCRVQLGQIARPKDGTIR